MEKVEIKKDRETSYLHIMILGLTMHTVLQLPQP